MKRLPSLVAASMCALACVVLGQAGRAAGQATTGDIAGTVRDGRGGPLTVRATVTATSIENGRTRTARTKDAGTFRIAQLPPGRYVLEATADGFVPARVANVEVEVGRTIDVPISLSASPAPASRTASAPSPETELRSGSAVARDVEAGASNVFGLSLRAGDLAEVRVESAGGTVVRVYDPQRRRLPAVERPARDDGEHLFVLARESGEYRLEIHLVAARGHASTVRLTVVDVRAARPRDEATVDALRRQWWAGQLRAQRTPAALAEALARYEEVLRAWRSMGDSDGEAYVLEEMALVYETLGDAAKAAELRRTIVR